MKNSIKLKLISFILVCCVLFSTFPLSSVAKTETEEIHFGLVSDIHYYPNSLKGNFCEEFKNFSYYKNKEYTEINSLLSNALDGVYKVLSEAETNHYDYLLIPGDLTTNGEYESHVELASILENWEKRTGIPVFVINGNHDINNSNTSSFVDGTKKKARKTTPEEFLDIYKNLGWDLADDTFTPNGYSEDYDGIKAGMCSYTAPINDKFRLIAVDGGIYSVDNGAKSTEHLTDGQIGDELLSWVIEKAQQAKAEGRTPIVLQHHNLVPHMDIEEATFWAFICYDWERIADAYADAGIHYVFTGHLHAADTSSYVSDNGERITDILSPTLTGYPNYFRTVTLTTDSNQNTKLEQVNWDIDDESLGLPQIVSDYGEVFERPYRLNGSFQKTFGQNIEDFIEILLEDLINTYFTQIKEAGGLIPFLKSKDIDVEKILVDLIGTDGIKLNNTNILSVSGNVMNFINDIDKQIMDTYITKPEETLDKVMMLVNKLLSLKVSDYPCTLNYELLGGTPTNEGCTFGEYATSALLLYYGGNESVYDENGKIKDNYKYIDDTLERFDDGSLTESLFNLLREVLITDLIENEILANIDLNPGKLFPEDEIFGLFGKILQAVTEGLLGGDNSLSNLIDTVLGLDIVPDGYNSIDEILDTLVIDRYLTQSQFESWGHTFKWMIKSLVFDNNPGKVNGKYIEDHNTVITYSGKEYVDATKVNFRLPADVHMTLNGNEQSSVTITWLTKYSILDSDIELLEYSENPKFTGIRTTDSRVNASYEHTIRSYPGADLGIFGLLPLEKDYILHTVTVNGLEAGKKYSYRVGSESKGWWSDTGTITTSKGKEEAFTFINITDPQAQRPEHYETYGKVMNKALELYPDARFTVSCGDHVDLGTNSKHWNYFFGSSNTFLSLPLMPTTGNHEKSGEVLKTNFKLPNVPKQDESTGTYYSYDYNNIHFTVLNTNDINDDDMINDEQIEWMKNDIKNSNAKWKIVVLHKALYCNGIYYKDSETVALRNQLSALLPYLGVDLVLSGHNHVYSRTGVMNANCLIPTETSTKEYNGKSYEMKINPLGTIYSIICSAGVKEYNTASLDNCYDYFPELECVVSNDEPMFAAITVDGDSLYYNAYQVKDNETVLADSFGITKTKDNAISDKIGDNIVDKLIQKLLSKINVKITWKFNSIIISIFKPIISLFQLILK